MNNLFEIKVCGINDEISMETALKCKVDYVGLVFYENSPRNISINLSKKLLKSRNKTTKIVALTVDPNDNFLNEITDGFIERIKNSSKFLKLKEGSFVEFHLPFSLKLDSLIVVKKPNNFNILNAREIGADLSAHLDERNASIFSEDEDFLTNVLFGFEVRSYHFVKYKSIKKTNE